MGYKNVRENVEESLRNEIEFGTAHSLDSTVGYLIQDYTSTVDLDEQEAIEEAVDNVHDDIKGYKGVKEYSEKLNIIEDAQFKIQNYERDTKRKKINM